MDVEVRASDGIFFVRVEKTESMATCSSGFHNFAMKLGSASASALYTLFLTAQASEKTVYIQGLGVCIPGTGVEEMREANIGPWAN